MFAQTPLAIKMRPQRLCDIIGQKHLVDDGMIFDAMAKKRIFQNILLWGPPGTGKTSIAYALANETDSNFRRLDATNTGTKELRIVLKFAKEQDNHTILVVDEIQRWAKNVQDILLSAVEDGVVTLIGLTIESARFAVNKALLSRCLVLETKPLDSAALILLIKRVKNYYKDIGRIIEINREAARNLVIRANGDARKIVLVMETLIEIISTDDIITQDDLNLVMPDKNLFFDARGNERYNYAHCYQEAIQHSDVDGAIYWLAKWIESGEDPAYICRRMLITAFEDCAGNPFAASTAAAACLTVERTGLPECMIPMALATCEMAKSKRNKSAFYAINAAMKDVRHGETVHVPPELRAGTVGYVKTVTKQYLKGWKRDWDDIETEDRVLVPDSIQNNVMYGIGIETTPGSIGMTHGPSPSLNDMLDIVGSDNAVIIKFVGDIDTILYRWDGDMWVDPSMLPCVNND